MAIFRLSGQDQVGFANLATVNVTYPSATTKGNLLIAAVVVQVNGLPTVTGGTWTLMKSGQFNSNTFSVGLFYKIADGTETTITGGLAGGAHAALSIFEYTGNANPLVTDGTAAINFNASALTSWATPTITTGNAYDLIFVVMGIGTTGGGTITSPSWTTSTLVGSNLNAFTSLFCGEKIFNTPQTNYSDTGNWTTGRASSAIIGAFSGPVPMQFNNYQFVKAPEGISVTEKIR